MIGPAKRGIKHLRKEGTIAFGRAALGYPFNLYNRARLGSGVDVLEEDWDNLILLDACRFDAFRHACDLEGELESRISKGSSSREFIRKNFLGKKLHDTVYLSANPYIGEIEPGTFHATITLLDEWDSELQTVLPEKVTERTIDEYKHYKDKRLIVHYMQPHQPYIGERSEYIRSEINRHMVTKGFNNPAEKSQKTDKDRIKMTKAPHYSDVNVTRDDIKQAYMETLDIALSSVEKLIQSIEGKTVISSDHGELLGEKINPFRKAKYGHPVGQYTPELREVPWFITESKERRHITESSPGRYEVMTGNKLDSRLQALGYK